MYLGVINMLLQTVCKKMHFSNYQRKSLDVMFDLIYTRCMLCHYCFQSFRKNTPYRPTSFERLDRVVWFPELKWATTRAVFTFNTIILEIIEGPNTACRRLAQYCISWCAISGSVCGIGSVRSIRQITQLSQLACPAPHTTDTINAVQ